MAHYVVAEEGEIPLGGRKIVEVAGRSIGVFNVNGEYFALRNRCPHQGGPLCEGKTWGALTADKPGEFVYSRPGEIVACIWHGWEFDLRTGQSWCDPVKLRVRRYEVSLEDVADEPAADEPAPPAPDPDAPAPGMVRGPYVAETYPVSIAHRHILIELDA
jgi:3-phenylpropionate/trans-cinnamate dioxygenase ferredoxin subunit